MVSETGGLIMIPFKNYLKTDYYKLWKSPIGIIHFFIPIVGLILMLAYFNLSSWDQLEKVSAYIQVISMAFPLIISIVVTMVYEQEEEAKGFQYFLSAASKRYLPHISKLFLLFIFGVVSTIISILGFGVIFNFIDKEYISIMFYLKEAAIVFISNIPLYMIQYLVVFYLGKGSSIGMGIIGSLVTALMITGIGDKIWFVLPWGCSIRLSSYFFQYEITNNWNLALRGEIKLAIASLIFFTVIAMISLMIFSNFWEGKKEYS